VRGAIAELGVHAWLLRMGFKPQAQAKVQEQTPDFLIPGKDGSQDVVVEVRGLNASDVDAVAWQKYEWLMGELLYAAPKGYNFEIDLTDKFDIQAVPAKRDIQRQLAVGCGVAQRINMGAAGEVTAHQVGSDAPSYIGALKPGRWVRDEGERLTRNALCEKSHKYRSLVTQKSLPYVIATWNFTEWPFTEDDLEDVWYGRVADRSGCADTPGPGLDEQLVREPNGFATCRDGEWHAHVTAMMCFHYHIVTGRIEFHAHFLPNPYAAQALPEWSLGSYRRAAVHRDKVPGPHVTWEGCSLWHVRSFPNSAGAALAD